MPSPWVTAALDLVFPACCPVCDGTLGAGRRDPLCGACWEGIARLGPPCCESCGRPLAALPSLGAVADTAVTRHCGACLLAPPPFAWARSAARYAGVVREALHALKFERAPALARPLADLTVEQWGAALPAPVDGVVPVPLGRDRLRTRGYNQAALLADRVARRLGVPTRGRWLERARETTPQSELPAAARRANVRGAFRAAPAVAGRRVLLVDDVWTTGATVAECAGALVAAGADGVAVLTVARVAHDTV
jgi:ComF family protein